MPRRIGDYPDAFAGWNAVSSLGSIISIGSTVLFAYIVYDMFLDHQVTESDPWETTLVSPIVSEEDSSNPSLEWSLSTPINMHSYPMLPAQSTD